MATQKNRLALNAIARITLGLLGLILSIVILADVLFGIIPNKKLAIQKERTQFVQSLTVQLISLVEKNDASTINHTINNVTTHNADILSIGIRMSDGWLAYATNNHLMHWQLAPLEKSTIDQMRIPIYNNGKDWGNVEVSFQSKASNGMLSLFNKHYLVLIILTFITAIFIYFYLSRALHYLSPSKAVPSRVHNAFDIITDSIIVLDKQGKIVLANNTFKMLENSTDEQLYGKTIQEIDITQGLTKQLDKGERPWEETFTDINFHTHDNDNKPLMLLASCAPVLDDDGQSRGFLITLKNITELHETNQKLSATLQELKLSRAKLELNNEQLQEMAYRDSLTGCFNRRAFSQKAEDLFTLASQGNRELYCVMADIDFFKSFNDIYGHYVGDQVIQIVAKILTSALRPTDIICRYGGEEFCIVITDASQEQALAICERMRSAIEDTANQSLRNEKVKQITASFGIASITSGAKSIETLIDYADNALYISKESGRNQVNQWISSMVE